MAIKRYPTSYVKVYQHKYGNEVEDIVFMANGYLFPLFKSFAGIELDVALEEYRRNILGILSEENTNVLYQFEAAENPDDKLKVISQNTEIFLSILKAATDTAQIKPGLSLIELIMITMHVCALPEADHAEALSIGYELLPEELYQEPQLAFELLTLALKYNDNVKKNATLLRGRAAN
jgi:hypothetical protein